MKVQIRWMIRRDMPEVLAIENQSLEDPWTKDDFIRALRIRTTVGLVAEHNDQVVGFMVFDLGKAFVTLLNIAVRKDRLRLYVGTQLVQKQIGKLSPNKRNRIVLHIREENLAGQMFFKRLGFIAEGICKEYFRDGSDAYQFVYRLEQPQFHQTNRVSHLGGAVQ